MGGTMVICPSRLALVELSMLGRKLVGHAIVSELTLDCGAYHELMVVSEVG